MGMEEVRALRGVSLIIEKGEYVAIMGPSGSGKSTLMNIIGCLDSPTSGGYELNGKQVSQMSDDELDVELLMWDLRRRIDSKSLPDGETVMSFHFKDIENYGTWWLVCSGGDIDLCTENPGKDVDLYVTTDIRSMIEVWQGDRSLSSALDEELITTVGSAHLMRNMKDWFALCSYKDYRPVELGVNPEEMVP